MSEDWRPCATIDTLKYRARVLHDVRLFMAERDIMEVDTPALSRYTVTEPNIASFETELDGNDIAKRRKLYLQSSPEYYMKRLLAADSGPIYQLGKVYRNNELGRLHSPEFTMLEWYEPGLDHHGLIQVVDQLLRSVCGLADGVSLSYRELFGRYLGIDPHIIAVNELAQTARAHQKSIDLTADESNRSQWLDFVFSELVLPELCGNRAYHIYDFPLCQAMLAKTRDEGSYQVAERFETVINGIELTNGFHELTDPEQQKRRFEQDQAIRHQNGQKVYDIDQRLIEAMQAGLPPCSGVSIGIDRLLMVMTGANELSEVLPFQPAL